MKKITKWTVISASILSILMLFASIAQADGKATYATDSLHFILGADTVLIPGTTETDDTAAVIAFSLYFDSEYLINNNITGDITSGYFKFGYLFDSLTYGTCYAAVYWDGDISVSSVDTVGDSVYYTFFFSSGSVDPPTTETVFAYIELKPTCQSGNTRMDLDFDATTCNDNSVIIGDEYQSMDKIDRWIDIEEYKAEFWIQSDSLTGGALGTIISVSVYWKNNFYVRNLVQYITIDTELLQCTDFYAAVPSDWSGFKTCFLIGNSLMVLLTNGASNHADQYNDSTLLYTFEFRVRYEDIAWESGSTALNFLEEETVVYPFSCYIIDNISLTHTDGTIKIAPYETDLTYRFTGDPIGYQDSITHIWVQAKNTFPMGDTTNSIMVNLALGEDFNDADASGNYTPDSALKFSFATYDGGGDNQQARIRQEYEAGIDNYWSACDTFRDFFKVALDFDYDSYTPSFDDRFLKLDFLEVFNSDDTMHVDDTTGSVSARLDNGKLNTSVTDSLEIMLGEFSVDSIDTECDQFIQPVYIRNTFDVDSFHVKIEIAGDYFHINDVECANNVSYSQNDTSTIIYCGSSDGPSANGSDYTKIACIRYHINGDCTPGNYYTEHVYITDTFMMTSDTAEPFYLAVESGIRGKCPHPLEICFIEICFMGGGKIASENSSENNIEEASLLPTEFNLHCNRPNPFNPITAILYDVPVTEHVRIEVYNILGQKVKTLVDELKAPGTHEVLWDGTDEYGIQVSTGIYLYNMQAGEFRQSRKMMLMK